MSFVTTHPAALMAAASALQTLGHSMAAENAAAATPVTGVAPAAADEISALQATQFAAYGSWYQQISAQATAMHEMLVATLGTNADSYGETEAANHAAASSASLSGIPGALALSDPSSTGLDGILSSASEAPVDPPGLPSEAGASIGTPALWGSSFGSAASAFTALGQGQFVPSGSGASTTLSLTDAISAGPLSGAAGRAGLAGFGGASVLASMGQASSVGGLSVPPTWAAGGAPAATATPAALTGTGWTSAATQSAPVTPVPAGMPSVASAGRRGFGFGAPRYGVKPIVMPKPTSV
jgi:PE family protein/PPE family protein